MRYDFFPVMFLFDLVFIFKKNQVRNIHSSYPKKKKKKKNRNIGSCLFCSDTPNPRFIQVKTPNCWLNHFCTDKIKDRGQQSNH